MSQVAANPRARAATIKFMQTAPAESTCSHSGIFGWGAARETTATTSGARANRPSSSAFPLSSSSGLSSSRIIWAIRPARSRAAPANMMKRHGASLPWSGTREATVSIVSSSSAVGPGPVMAVGGAERRRLSKAIVSFMRVSCRAARTFTPSGRAAHRLRSASLRRHEAPGTRAQPTPSRRRPAESQDMRSIGRILAGLMALALVAALGATALADPPAFIASQVRKSGPFDRLRAGSGAPKPTRKGKDRRSVPQSRDRRQSGSKSGLKSAVEMHDKLRTGPLVGLRLALLHGRLDADEKEIVMRRPAQGRREALQQNPGNISGYHKWPRQRWARRSTKRTAETAAPRGTC